VKIRTSLILVATVAIWFPIAHAAAQTGVMPARGQTAEQRAKDVAACQSMATQSSGYNPAAPPPAPTGDGPHVGGRVKGGATGAAAGRTAAQVRGNQHEEAYDRLSDEAKREYRKEEGEPAAAAGAVVGASRQRRDRRKGRREEKDAEAQIQSAEDVYGPANNTCLAGRGYTVTP
jgi:hypothetical protein